jgi:hypothetical protein
MTIDLEKMSADELVALNHRIVERLKYLESEQTYRSMMEFNIGAKVSFESRDGRELGTLVKYNRKTVTVIAEDGARWNISPHLLTLVKDVGPTQTFEYAGQKNLE